MHDSTRQEEWPAGLPDNTPHYDKRSQLIASVHLCAHYSQIIVEATQLYKVTVSFGNVNSLISLPCYMSHASIPAEVRAARGLPDDLVRISTGIEDARDLIADLDQVRVHLRLLVGFVCVCVCVCVLGKVVNTSPKQTEPNATEGVEGRVR